MTRRKRTILLAAIGAVVAVVAMSFRRGIVERFVNPAAENASAPVSEITPSGTKEAAADVDFVLTRDALFSLLRKYLSAGSAERRNINLELRGMASKHPLVFADVILGAFEKQLRSLAALALTEVSEDSALLIRILRGSREEIIRRMLIERLAELQATDAAQAIADIGMEPGISEDLFSHVLKALGVLSRDFGRGLAVRALSSEADFRLHRHAARFLAGLNDPEDAAWLLSLWRTRASTELPASLSKQQFLLEALAGLEPRPLEDLAREYVDSESDVGRRNFFVFEMSRADAAFAIKFLEDTFRTDLFPATRRQAIIAMAHIRSADSRRALIQLLAEAPSDGDREIILKWGFVREDGAQLPTEEMIQALDASVSTAVRSQLAHLIASKGEQRLSDELIRRLAGECQSGLDSGSVDEREQWTAALCHLARWDNSLVDRALTAASALPGDGVGSESATNALSQLGPNQQLQEYMLDVARRPESGEGATGSAYFYLLKNSGQDSEPAWTQNLSRYMQSHPAVQIEIAERLNETGSDGVKKTFLRIAESSLTSEEFRRVESVFREE
ncbi:MAG: hypothetical protein HYY18_14705 [Planctomycetes bacterium]|nr:hypothetical protein [Planctomycetota bacterium]